MVGSMLAPLLVTLLTIHLTIIVVIVVVGSMLAPMLAPLLVTLPTIHLTIIVVVVVVVGSMLAPLLVPLLVTLLTIHLTIIVVVVVVQVVGSMLGAFTGDVTHNTFNNNSRGGFYVSRTFTGNVIYNNFTRNAGGGCWIRKLAGTISHNIFDSNSAYQGGGGFELHEGSPNTVEVFNNIFFNNTAKVDGQLGYHTARHPLHQQPVHDF